MSVVSVNARSFILALFIRDDGERFLLGDNGYDFKGSQLHFAANTIENDEVMKQGADGVMVAGQVRRASVQSFDGYVGDATMAKETIEQMRRDFFAFFVKGHHFRVVYIDCNRNAWQRKGGYLVDAPEVKELWQIHPEYHVGLNFEDVNYYSYDEDADGEEILSNLIDVPVSTAASGGLVWDEDGAVSEDAEIEYDTETAGATGKAIAISDAAEAPLSAFKLDGETSQNGTPTPSAPVPVQTVTGENVVQITGKNLFDKSNSNLLLSNVYIGSSSLGTSNGAYTAFIECSPNTTYTISKTAGARFICGTTTTLPATGVAIANRTTDNTASSITLTTSSTAKYLVVFYYLASADTGTQQAMLDSLQFELGSTATAYEPYQEQSYEVNLGKNLLEFASTYTHLGITTTLNNDGTITISNTPTNNYANVIGMKTIDLPAGTYTLSRFNTTRNFTIRLYWADGTYNNYNLTSSSNTFTTTKQAVKFYMWIYGLTPGTEMNETMALQLEKGSATSFAAYFEPIELCKIGDYQDYIYKDGSDWKIHKATGKQIVDTSTITLRSNYANVEYGIFSKPNDFIGYHNYNHYDCYCSHATPAASPATGWDNAARAGYIYDTAYDLGYWVGFAKGTGLDNIKAALSGCLIYYILATPTDTEITDEALVAQLNALLTTARTYAGINNIFTITPNEQGTLEVGYYTKYQPMVVSGGYVWEAGGAGGATIVVNNSIDNVNPIWKIYGPTMNPQLENSTTGEVIEYVGLVAEGQTLTIDMGEQTASLDGLNVISNLVGDFVSLAPGANRLIYSVSGDAGASEIGWSEIVG